MTPYLENRNGYKYEFKPLTRRQKIELSNVIKGLGEGNLDFTKLEDVVYTCLKYNYPELTPEEYENILDYNEREYGFNELYEILGYIVEDVFTLAGGTHKTNAYLEEKRLEKELAKEEENKEKVETESPQITY